MTLTHKQKKMIGTIAVFILVYFATTLLLYNIILDPQVNKITGRVASAVNVTQTAQSICDFPLYTGQNHISFHCMHGFFIGDYMLAPIAGEYNAVFTYETTDSNDPWKSYNPNLPVWAEQDMAGVYDYKGYWIIMNQNTSYYLDGFFNMNNQQQLYTGWNLIGYPRENATTPGVAYASLNGNYNLVIHYIRQNNTWVYYAPGDPNSTLTQIQPDEGYWINMTADDMWVFP